MRRWLEAFQMRVDAAVARWNTSLRRFSVFAIGLDTLDAFNADFMSVLAASLSYYSLLALFPLLLVLIAVASFFVSEVDALTAVTREASPYLPGASAELSEILRQVVELRGSATILGFITLLWSASGVFDVLQQALDRAWRVPTSRSFWLQRLFSIAVTGILGAALLVSIAVTAISESVVFDVVGESDTTRELIRMASQALGLGLAFVAFAVLYKTFPHAQVPWRNAVLGAVTAAVLWQIAKFGYQFYLVRFARFSLVYGSVGAIIGLLLWGYISSLTLLFGAELSATLGRRARDGGMER